MRASVNLTRVRIAMGRELIDDGAAGIAEAEQFCDFVVSFASRIVARFAEQAIPETFTDFEQVRVAAADDQRQRGIFDARASFQNHGMNMAFDMVHGDERQVASEAERFGIRDADQQRADQARGLR